MKMTRMVMLPALVLLLSLAPRSHAQDQQQPAQAQQSAQGTEGRKPQWKSREEYDDFQKIAAEKDPQKKIALAEAAIQKYPNSDFKDAAYVQEIAAYQQLNQPDKAIEAARKALQANPDNLDALSYLSYTFPYTFKPADANASTELSEAESNAKKGLEELQKLQKPANVTEEQFNSYVKPKRAIMNTTLGFVAFQRKDYASAITSLKAAIEDNPSDPLAFSLLGQAYIYSNPPDYDNGLWNLARSVALAKAANSPNAAALQKFYSQAYEARHGSDQGEQDLINQASASVTPPAGFKVAVAERHKPTGNEFVDAFYGMEDDLKAGGDTAQQAWEKLKGQPFGGPGFVDSVEKGSDPGSCLIHVDITPDSKAKDGVYDVDLKDSQPGCKDLAKGDPVRFQGTIASYTNTPSFVLTLDNVKINEEDLAAAAEARKKTKTPPHRRPRQGSR